MTDFFGYLLSYVTLWMILLKLHTFLCRFELTVLYAYPSLI